MTLDITFISIIAALAVAGHLIRQILRRRNKERFSPDMKEPVDKSCLLLTVQPCRSIIDK